MPSDFELVLDRSGLVMPALVAACPSFEADRASLPVSLGDTGAPYQDIADFARHLVAKLERNEVSEFPEVFGEIERLLGANQVGVRELLVVGLLEDLQGGSDGVGRDLVEGFRAWLGPITSRAWDEVASFWRDVDLAGDLPGS